MVAKAGGKKLKFVKMHGTGNDIILFDCLKQTISNPPHTARKLCNRHTGIGADQLILLLKSRKADFAMRIFNSDGSEAEMCGNGIRCLANYIKHAKISQKKEFQIETLAGIRPVKFIGKSVEVNMGEPIMKGKEIPVNLSGRVVNRPIKVDSKEFRITCISMGNPHCIIFNDDLDNFDIDRFGPQIETAPTFPKKTNVSFVNVLSKKEIHIRVWERGSGETLSCGTAACASAIASVLNSYTDRKVTAHLPGGKIDIDWRTKDNHVYMKGPADIVYFGELSV